MLERITLKNFKLHASTEIDAARITVFIGPNNSGKSSVAQAVFSLRQAALKADSRFVHRIERGPTSPEKPYFYAPEESLNIGEFEDIARERTGNVEVKLAGTVMTARAGSLSVQFSVLVRSNELASHAGEIRSRYSPLSWQWVKSTSPVTQAIQTDGSVLRLGPIADFRLLNLIQIDSPPQISASNRLEVDELGKTIAGSPVALLKSSHLIFPVRGFEEWGFLLPDDPAESLDRAALADRALSLVSVIAYKEDVERRISDWLESLLQIRIEKALSRGKRVGIRTIPVGKTAHNFLGEGTGANQLAFILVPIGLTSHGDSIFLSEPEAHLHPALQSKLISLLIRIARDESKQFFLETHSEHVLHALLHAVAKGELAQTDLGIYYFENAHGEAKVTRLKIDERGGVEGGLPGFFDHALTELSELLETSKRK